MIPYFSTKGGIKYNLQVLEMIVDVELAFEKGVWGTPVFGWIGTTADNVRGERAAWKAALLLVSKTYGGVDGNNATRLCDRYKLLRRTHNHILMKSEVHSVANTPPPAWLNSGPKVRFEISPIEHPAFFG